MRPNPIKRLRPLTSPWSVPNPFLFCVHHQDAYPVGNSQLGPAVSLDGRNLGEDFSGKDGWRMYHGETVPGFPRHPHRGFETITILLKGYIDHTDSLGTSGRYGPGDVQWMTAGRGISHSEMFPLLNQNQENPVELFQIWLNLPKSRKLVDPDVKLFWSDMINKNKITDPEGRTTEITIVAGDFGETKAPTPPKHSWASDPANDVAIWIVKMEPKARFILPSSSMRTNRTLYFFQGSLLAIAGTEIQSKSTIEVESGEETVIQNGNEEAHLLVLQGCPIEEPIAAAGPFVMNTEEEIHQAFEDYRHTHFGGWPWPKDEVVFPPEESRFVRYADGRVERRKFE